MRKKQLSFICFLFSYLFMFGNGNTINLLYDSSCMDKFEYVLKKKNPRGTSNTGYTTYHIKINDSEKVILNTGAAKREAIKPANTKYCGEIVISESFARKINTKKDIVNLVIKDNGNYLVIPVISADYFFTTDSEMGFATKEFTFAYNYIQGGKKNLATKESLGNVYFRDRNDNTCPSKYTFRRTPPKNFDPYSDFILVPDVGLIQKKTGLDAATANSNVLELRTINGIPLAQYMDAVCNGYVSYLSKDNKNTSTNTSTASHGGKTSVTDLESGRHNSGASSGSGGHVYHGSSDCDHLYKDVDKGFYYNRNTGNRANETCGGITYNMGMMVSNTQPIPPSTSTARTNTGTRIVHNSTPETKIVYRDSPPKVVYKDRIVYVDRPIDNAASTATVVTSNSDFHIVQPGETLYNLSKRYKVPVGDIKRWNGLKGDIISIGQNIRVRGQAISSATASTTTSQASTTTYTSKGSSNYHVVRAKETLYRISKRYGISVERLKALNNLKSNTLSIGQSLRLTGDIPTSYNTTVRIPQEYSPKNQPQEVLTSKGTATSSTTTSTTVIGTNLIGNNGTTSLIKATDPLANYDSSSQKIHIVQDNENLYMIAKWYNTTVENIRKLNNFDRNEVIITAQKIRVQ